MKNRLSTLILFLSVTLTYSCKKAYTPPSIASANSYLVVEGVINTGNDSTIFKLSRTVNVSAGITANPEKGSSVTVEDNAGNSFPLAEISAGNYASPALNLDNSKKYRLRIKTSNGQEYLSDFDDTKITPPIDSIGFALQGNGLQIYVNAHDPNNNTHYYRWEYDETWRFHSRYFSGYITNGTKIVARDTNQQVYYCFTNSKSSSITLGSSAKLRQDVIFQNPIIQIPSTSEKIELKYSILLKQYALTTSANNFWISLKKNTEQLGSIFDAQPSQLTGNIHNINNPAEAVIGYISACTMATKRIFISNDQLPQDWQPKYPYSCDLDSNFYVHPVSLINDVANNLIPIPPAEYPTSTFYLPGAKTPSGYLGTNLECIDCTLRGFKQQPAFWK